MTSKRYECDTIGRVEEFANLRWGRDLRRHSESVSLLKGRKKEDKKERKKEKKQQQQNRKRLHDTLQLTTKK